MKQTHERKETFFKEENSFTSTHLEIPGGGVKKERKIRSCNSGPATDRLFISSERAYLKLILYIFLTVLLCAAALCWEMSRWDGRAERFYKLSHESSLAAIKAYTETKGSGVEKLRASWEMAAGLLGDSAKVEKPTPGRFFYFPVADCSAFDPKTSCPCPGGKWEKPCFMALPEDSAEITTLRLNQQDESSSLVQRLILKLAGLPQKTVRSDYPASLPRRAVIIENYSRFMPEDEKADSHAAFIAAMDRVRKETLPLDEFRIISTDNQNLKDAILNAAKEARASYGALDVAQMFVVVLTDGMSLCEGAAACSEETFKKAFLELDAFSRLRTEEGLVNVHILLTGSQLHPHKLLAKSRSAESAAEATCLEQEEANLLGLQLVDARSGEDALKKSILDKDPAQSFFGANALYTISQRSGAFFFPLRDCCRDEAGKCANVTEKLNALCAAGAERSEQLSLPYFSAPISLPTPVQASPYTDSSGRLLCDPQGRAKPQQLEEAISKILSYHPAYTLLR